jgi:hypothetical protein
MIKVWIGSKVKINNPKESCGKSKSIVLLLYKGI